MNDRIKKALHMRRAGKAAEQLVEDFDLTAVELLDELLMALPPQPMRTCICCQGDIFVNGENYGGYINGAEVTYFFCEPCWVETFGLGVDGFGHDYIAPDDALAIAWRNKQGLK
jgi:hypothetical protein